MRILLASRARSGHDRRFAAAWGSLGAEVAAIHRDSWSSREEFRRGIRETLDSFRPDVVHAGPLTDVVGDVALHWDGPLVAASWGFDLLLEARENLEHRRRAASSVERADHLLVDNDAVRVAALDLGADPAAITQFPWGVDLQRFHRGPAARKRWTTGDRVVLCTRAHEPIYDVATVIRGFAAAASADPRLRLSLVGTGSLEGQHRDLTRALNVHERVQFFGALVTEDIAAAYRSADVYVSASLVDGSSVSLLEAMASGAPAVVSRIPGNAEWVSEETGWDFPVGDWAELGRILQMLCVAEGAVIAARTEAAHHRVTQRADWRRNLRALTDVARRARTENTRKREHR